MKTLKGIALPLLILLVLLSWYLIKQRKDIKEGAIKIPIVELFLIIVTYGVLLFMILITASGEWSALSSVGAFYLLIIAPLLMSLIAYALYNKYQLSKYYKWAYILSLLYFVILILTLILSLILVNQ